MTSALGHNPTRTLQTRLGLIRANAVFLPAVIGLLAFVVSAISIDVASLWFDEAATVGAATRTLPELVSLLRVLDAVHGLYYLLIYGVFELVGYTPLTLRLPSALAVGVCAAGVVVLARLVSGERVALIAGLVFCVLPRVTWMGSEGRSYAFTAAAAVWLTVSFVVATREKGRARWIVYGVIAWISVVLFIYLALVIAVHGIAVVASKSRRSLRNWGLAAGFALIGASPVIVYSARERAQVDWLRPPTIGAFEDVVRDQWFMPSWPLAIVAWMLVGFAVFYLARERDASLMLLLGPLALPPLVFIVVSFFIPLYNPRYFSYGAPLVAVLIAIGITRVPWRPVKIVAVVAIVALAVPVYLGQRSPTGKGTSWAQLADRVAAERADDPAGSVTAFIFGTYTYTTARVVATAYAAPFTDAIDVTFLEGAGPAADLFDNQLPLGESLDRLKPADVAYLLTTDLTADYVVERNLLLMGNWRSTDVWIYTEFRVERWVRD